MRCFFSAKFHYLAQELVSAVALFCGEGYDLHAFIKLQSFPYALHIGFNFALFKLVNLIGNNNKIAVCGGNPQS